MRKVDILNDLLARFEADVKHNPNDQQSRVKRAQELARQKAKQAGHGAAQAAGRGARAVGRGLTMVPREIARREKEDFKAQLLR